MNTKKFQEGPNMQKARATRQAYQRLLDAIARDATDLPIGTIVKVKQFTFVNQYGGTWMSNSLHNEQYPNLPFVKIVHKLNDSECGCIYHAVALDEDKSLNEYLDKNASKDDRRLFISQFDVVKIGEL